MFLEVIKGYFRGKHTFSDAVVECSIDEVEAENIGYGAHGAKISN